MQVFYKTWSSHKEVRKEQNTAFILGWTVGWYQVLNGSKNCFQKVWVQRTSWAATSPSSPPFSCPREGCALHTGVSSPFSERKQILHPFFFPCHQLQLILRPKGTF